MRILIDLKPEPYRNDKDPFKMKGSFNKGKLKCRT